MSYYLIEEASEAIEGIYDNVDEAIQEVKLRKGKYFVVDNDDKIYFDSEPDVSYKI